MLRRLFASSLIAIVVPQCVPAPGDSLYSQIQCLRAAAVALIIIARVVRTISQAIVAPAFVMLPAIVLAVPR